jgi:hypothetical protein
MIRVIETVFLLSENEIALASEGVGLFCLSLGGGLYTISLLIGITIFASILCLGQMVTS